AGIASAQGSTGATIPAPFDNPNRPVRIALVREIGEGGFMERYLAGAQSMAAELGVQLVESNARGDLARMVTNIETAINQRVDAIIVDHGRTDALQPAIEIGPALRAACWKSRGATAPIWFPGATRTIPTCT